MFNIEYLRDQICEFWNLMGLKSSYADPEYLDKAFKGLFYVYVNTENVGKLDITLEATLNELQRRRFKYETLT